MIKKDIVLDTDVGADADDVVALAILSNAINKGIINCDTITCSTNRKDAPSCIRAILDFFKIKNIHIGQLNTPLKADKFDYYNSFIANKYLMDNSKEDATKLLRRKLAQSRNITLVSIGPLTNIKNLLTSKKDEISNLSGEELFSQSVKECFVMAGKFNGLEAEFNVEQDIEAAETFFKTVKCPIYVIPSEVGTKFCVGNVLTNEIDNPVRDALEQFNLMRKVNDLDRETWDPQTIFAAIYGTNSYINSNKGIVEISKKGISKLVKDDNGNTVVLDLEEKNINKVKNQIDKLIKKENIKMASNVKGKKQLEQEKRNNAKISSILYPSDVDNTLSDDEAYIILDDVNKIYDNDVQAVFNFNLKIRKKEFIVFVGPSGCGKSTTLRMIAGLEEISSGDLFIDGKYTNDTAPKNRDIAMVFQSYALYPHMTVYNNLAFGLKIKKVLSPFKNPDGTPVKWIDKRYIKDLKSQLKDCDKAIKIASMNVAKLEKLLSNAQLSQDMKDVYAERAKYFKEQIVLANKTKEDLNKQLQKALTTPVDKYDYTHVPRKEIDSRVREAAKILEIEQYLDRKPKALSGGQRQRVALGRAIVRNAGAFLMDEPLSNLDAKLRVQMRSEIVALTQRIGSTTIYVTHDQTEAMTMADRIVVMKSGIVQQIGAPKDIYSHPKNLFVATFIGAPAMNILKAKYSNGTIILPGNQKIDLGKEAVNKYNKYYNDEIARMNNICLNMDKLAKDETDKNREVYGLAKVEALKHIKSFKFNLTNISDVLIGIRPEYISVSNKKTANAFEVKAGIVELLGSEYYIHTELDGQKFVIKFSTAFDVKTGDTIYCTFDKTKIHIFDKETERTVF